MKITQLFISLFVVVSFSQSALATSKKAKKKEVIVEEQKEYSMPLAQSEIQLHPVEAVPRTKHDLEFAASTWTPKSFGLASYLPDAGDVSRGGVPFLSVNYLTKLTEVGTHGDISSKFGLSYMNLQRTANFTGDNVHTAQENFNLFSLRMGAEYVIHSVLPWNLEPAFGLYLLPSWLVGSSSELDNGVSSYGFPVEASADLIYHSPTVSRLINNSDFIFGLGLHEIYGKISSSEISGLGVQGLLRLNL